MNRALLPAAVACAAFVATDAAFALAGDGFPAVVLFVSAPACWMALLVETAAPAEQLTSADAWFGLGVTAEVPKHGSPAQRARILPRLAPLAACLAYAAVLLALRHEPAVRAHWTGALQLPRLVAFGWALAVALRWRTKTNGPVATRGHQSRADRARREVMQLPQRHKWRSSSGVHHTYRPALPPSTAIGIVMALGGGICAAGGLWADWHDVRIVAAVAWGLSAAIAWRAR